MIETLALAFALSQPSYTVVPGDTLSSIAAAHGLNWQALCADNGISDCNLIYAGQQLTFSPATDASQGPAAYAPPSAGSGAGGLSDVPGVPSSFASCVAQRESGDGTSSGDVYGIIPASGYDVEGASLAQQKQAFASLYATYGESAWAPYDGC